MTKLSVNLNKIALLRNARPLDVPSVSQAAQVCVDAGADGITVHPRPDQRHIRAGDVYMLADMLSVELNVEGNPFSEYMDIVREVRPTQCTLVPDAPEQQTSDHGWDLAADGGRLRPVVDELKAFGTRVSLFMDPDCIQIERAAALGADRIELYTERYARDFDTPRRDATLSSYAQAAACAQELGLGVNAGHDLNLENLTRFCTIPHILECSIGHALIADALLMGLATAVARYREALRSPSTGT